MKPFDEKFADNVRDAFDSFEQDVDPAAWQAMQARMKKRRKASVIALFPVRLIAAVAASLLLAVAGWHFYNTAITPAETNGQFTSTQTPAPVIEKPDTISAEDTKPIDEKQSDLIVAEHNKPVYARQQPQADSMPAVVKQPQADKVNTPEITEQHIALTEITPEPADSVPGVVLPPLPPSRGSDTNPLMAVNGDPFDDFQPAAEKMQSWGVSAGSMFAFTPGSISDGLGVTAGVVSEWKVTPGITVATGGLLAYHQFELADYSRNESDYSGDAVSGISVSLNNHYELLSLDIPINAQFNLLENNNKRIYLGAGVSSLVYLQQNFTGQNTVYRHEILQDPISGAFHGVTVQETVTTNESHDAFSRFDFARLLNISIGYVVKANRGSYIIEPFIKYPVGKITSRDMRLGMGGISLRYNFSE